ncbi:hypothetical protein CJ030_MR7G027984 [Morella rubra]|uniref:Uncharacterized protein n=1 Tax=Morella rubra TaxID=262757 RepID=A0A6A1UZR6_9ROSI|nr:hypothetical protein CJ030_MR7G027984 [Morella rubra]
MGEKLMAADGDSSFVSKANDYSRAFLAQRCVNKEGRRVSGGKVGQLGSGVSGHHGLRGGLSFARAVKMKKPLVDVGMQVSSVECYGEKGNKGEPTLCLQERHADQDFVVIPKAPSFVDGSSLALGGTDVMELDQILWSLDVEGAEGKGEGWAAVERGSNGSQPGPSVSLKAGPLLAGGVGSGLVLSAEGGAPGHISIHLKQVYRLKVMTCDKEATMDVVHANVTLGHMARGTPLQTSMAGGSPVLSVAAGDSLEAISAPEPPPADLSVISVEGVVSSIDGLELERGEAGASMPDDPPAPIDNPVPTLGLFSAVRDDRSPVVVDSALLVEASAVVPVAANVISHALGLETSLLFYPLHGQGFKVSSCGLCSKGRVESLVFSGAVSVVKKEGVANMLRESVGRPGLLVGESASGSELQLVACQDGVVAFEERGGELCAEPLRIMHPGVDGCVGKGSVYLSSWVLEMVSSFRHLVGVSCIGYESELLNLFAALELERGSGSKSSGRSGGKLLRELKSLECSVNYNGSASGSRKNRKARRALVNYP